MEALCVLCEVGSEAVNGMFIKRVFHSMWTQHQYSKRDPTGYEAQIRRRSVSIRIPLRRARDDVTVWVGEGVNWKF
jgi:hypothetical protein